MRARALPVALLLAGLPLLAPAAQAADTGVAISGFSFGAAVTVDAGDTVTWTNHDGAPHTVTSDGGAGPLDSPNLAEDDAYAFLFLDAGTYPYHCKVHPVSMKSKVTVLRPAAPELVVASLVVKDAGPLAKEVRAEVASVGASQAGASRLLLGYEYQGGVVAIAELDVPPLAGGARFQASAAWDTTGLVGSFTVVALADHDAQVAEHREDNNRRAVQAAVLTGAVPGLDLLDPL